MGIGFRDTTNLLISCRFHKYLAGNAVTVSESQASPAGFPFRYGPANQKNLGGPRRIRRHEAGSMYRSLLSQNVLEIPNTAPWFRYVLMGMFEWFHSKEYPA